MGDKKLNFDLSFLDDSNQFEEEVSENDFVQFNAEYQEEYIKEIQSNSKHSSKTKSGKNITEDNPGTNWKPLIIISLIIIISCSVGFIYNIQKEKENTIYQIKDDAYEYLRNGDEDACDSELEKLYKYGIDIDVVKQEFIDRFNAEKKKIISDIAYNYEHDLEAFNYMKERYLPILFDNDEAKFNEIIEEELGYKELSLEPVEMPKSGIMHNYTNEEGTVPFEIITEVSNNDFSSNSGEDNYYIKLIDPYTDEDVIVIFVRSGGHLEINVPPGKYKIKEASGSVWYGEKNLFGHRTHYTKSDQMLTFEITGSYVKGNTLTLYKVANGNFRTEEISAEEF